MWQIFKDGGPVMVPLLACSILVLAVLWERTFFWVRSSMQRNQRLVDDVLELSRGGR